MAIKSTWTSDPNHIDHALGTRYGRRFQLENVIDGVIAFANGDVSPRADDHVLACDGFRDKDGTQWYLVGVPGKGVRKTTDRAVPLRLFREDIERERIYAVDTLAVIASGLGPLTKLLRSFGDINEAVDLATYPTLTYDESGRPITGWRTSGSASPKHWINFAALMSVPKEGELTVVGRCHLEGCNRFFRVERDGTSGKPTRKYCPGTDHMERAHKAGSTERSRRARAERKRSEALAKKPRRPK